MRKLFNRITVLATSLTLLTSCLVGCEKEKKSSTEVQKTEIKNVVIVIGDGMGFEHIAAGEMYESKQYMFPNWTQTAVNTDSIDGNNLVLTDSAAGGTAIATGVLTKNGYVGKNPNGEDLTTVLDLAKSLRKSTAVITTDKLYGATPASFSAHSLSRNYTEEIVESQIRTSNVDILCGAYSNTCNGYVSMIEEYGYTYCADFSKVDETLSQNKLYWQFDLAGTEATVELSDVVEKALTVLERDQDGFVMMIEQAYVDKYSHNNQIHGTAKSVKSLNETVESVMRWKGNRKDTAILITADHETGGLSVSENKMDGYQSWASDYGKRIYYRYETENHTRTPIGLFVHGVKPNFASYATYQDKSLIKNIETNQIIEKIIRNQTV